MASENWYTVDNVAKVFLATHNKRDTRSFRVSCTLKENIDPELLQQAVDLAAEQRPQYQVVIRSGLFWHYMEETDLKNTVVEEHERPCPTLYGKSKKEQLHYRVTYWNNRINLDMFHALTDGNGGLEFLNIIVLNYLNLKYDGALSEISMHSGAGEDDLNQDSFKHFYGLGSAEGKKSEGKKKKKQKSYHIKGLLLPYDQLQFFEIHMSAAEVLKLAKAENATMTSYLGASLMQSIYNDMPSRLRKLPITISMPVNLRNFYASATSRNFFNSVYVSHVFDGTETISHLASLFDAKLKEELHPDVIAQNMDNYQKLEQLLFIRIVPLVIKNPIVSAFAKAEKKNVSSVISNLGRINVPQEMSEYVEGYACFCSSETMFITVSTFGDDLTLGVSTPYRNTSVLKNLVRGITDKGIEATVYATEVTR